MRRTLILTLLNAVRWR